MMKRMFRTGAVVSLLICAALSSAYAQTDVFGVVEISSWNACTSNVLSLCRASVIPLQQESLNQIILPILHVPNLENVDRQNPIRLYLINKSQRERKSSSLVLALPLTDTDAYLNILSNAYATVVQTNGCCSFRIPMHPGEYPEKLHVIMINHLAVVGETLEDTLLLSRRLEAKTAPSIKNITADISASINIQMLMPMLEKNLSKARADVSKTPHPNKNPTNEATAAVLGTEMDTLLDILRQIRGLEIGLKMDAQAGSLLTCIDAKPDSMLAAILNKGHAPKDRYLSILPPETLIGSVGGTLAGMDLLAKPYMDFTTKILQAMPMAQPYDFTNRQAILTDLLKQYTGDYTWGLLPNAHTNGLVFAGVFAISDAGKMSETLKTLQCPTNSYWKQNPYGFSLTSLPERVYSGITVQAYHYQLLPSTNTLNADLPLGSHEALSLLAKLTIERAFVGKDLVEVYGSPGDIDPIIDRVQAKNNTLGFFKKAYACLEKKSPQPMDISYIRLSEAIPALLGLCDKVTPEQKAMLPKPGEGLVSYSYCRDNLQFGALRITTSEIRAMIQTVPALSLMLKTDYPETFKPKRPILPVPQQDTTHPHPRSSPAIETTMPDAP